jgi:hypothetical protein
MSHAPLPDPADDPAVSASSGPASTGGPAGDTSEGEHGSNRRTFLAGAGAATVLGAAVATGAGALTAGAGRAPQPDATPDMQIAGEPGGAVVAYLRDPARGEVRLMSGEREVVVHDSALARTITRHLAGHPGGTSGQER